MAQTTRDRSRSPPSTGNQVSTPCTSGVDVLVVGAGPAGIAAVLALQEFSVGWVDPEFSAGRLALWRTVPCNTKVDLLVGPAFFGHPLLDSVRASVEPAIQQLVSGAHTLPSSRDPSKLGFTYLGDCKAIYDAATAELLARERVFEIRGRVDKLAQDASGWSAEVRDIEGTSRELKARCVVLATGVEPKRVSGGSAIHLEDAFNAEVLASKLRPHDKVAVLGNSHSAAIALASIHALKEKLHLRVANFVRRPVRLAEWVPSLGTYRYTSTGLKGFGACFGQEHMCTDWNWVVDATGYVPSVLPEISGADISLERCEVTGRLGVELGMPGLFAVGAPWPEPAGRLWGKGLEDAEGFKTEGSFIGFHLFFSRSALIASEIASLLSN